MVARHPGGAVRPGRRPRPGGDLGRRRRPARRAPRAVPARPRGAADPRPAGRRRRAARRVRAHRRGAAAAGDRLGARDRGRPGGGAGGGAAGRRRPATTPSWPATRPPGPPGCPRWPGGPPGTRWRPARRCWSRCPGAATCRRWPARDCRTPARCPHCAGPLGSASAARGAGLPLVRPGAGRVRLPGAAAAAGCARSSSAPAGPPRSWAGRSPACRCGPPARDGGARRRCRPRPALVVATPGAEPVAERRLRRGAAAGRLGPADPGRPARRRGGAAPLARRGRAGPAGRRRRPGGGGRRRRRSPPCRRCCAGTRAGSPPGSWPSGASWASRRRSGWRRSPAAGRGRRPARRGPAAGRAEVLGPVPAGGGHGSGCCCGSPARTAPALAARAARGRRGPQRPQGPRPGPGPGRPAGAVLTGRCPRTTCPPASYATIAGFSRRELGRPARQPQPAAERAARRTGPRGGDRQQPGPQAASAGRAEAPLRRRVRKVHSHLMVSGPRKLLPLRECSNAVRTLPEYEGRQGGDRHRRRWRHEDVRGHGDQGGPAVDIRTGRGWSSAGGDPRRDRRAAPASWPAACWRWSSSPGRGRPRPTMPVPTPTRSVVSDRLTARPGRPIAGAAGWSGGRPDQSTGGVLPPRDLESRPGRAADRTVRQLRAAHASDARAGALRLVFAGTPAVALPLAARRCWPPGTRWSPWSPARTRRPAAGRHAAALAGRGAGRRGRASRC